MKAWLIVLLSLAVLVALIVLSFAMGYLDVFYMKTVGKDKENAKTVVYEESQSYNTGKKQELSKYYYEYIKADTQEKRDAIMKVVKMSFLLNMIAIK